jgi:DNA-binding transcriptional regulator YdaS (Cro superfamily)
MAKITIYRTYRFVDKDPLIDAMRTVVRDEQHLTNGRASAISGVSATTFHNWFEGSTRRPQNACCSAAMAALGYVRRDELTKDGQLIPGYVKARGTRLDYEKEIEKQADWLLQQGRKKRPRKKNGANK